MERYEIRLVIETDVEIEKVESLLNSIGNSGKVILKSLYSRRVRPPGRPDEMRQEVIDFLKSDKKARSALQISRKIDRPQTSLYRILNSLAAAEQVSKWYDARWRTHRYQWIESP